MCFLQMVSFLVFLFHWLYLHNCSLLVLLFWLFALLVVLGLLLHRLVLYLLLLGIRLHFLGHHILLLFGWLIESLVIPYLNLLLYDLPSLLCLGCCLHHIYLVLCSSSHFHFHCLHITRFVWLLLQFLGLVISLHLLLYKMFVVCHFLLLFL